MNKVVEVFQEDLEKWNKSLDKMNHVTSYHYWEFAKAVEVTYKHKAIRYALINSDSEFIATVTVFKFKPFLLKECIVSLPFCDYGGVVAIDDKSEKELLQFLLAKYRKDPLILRQLKPLECNGYKKNLNSEKVRMRFKLETESADKLLENYKAKLRAQIKRPAKDGCTAACGREELLGDFYKVFLYNMRDLGSPVHSRKLMENVLRLFGEDASLFVVYSKDKEPIACSMAIGKGNTLINPWASSDRRYQKIAPNMMLYWEMIKYAIEKKYKYFDFGRSTEGEGTYRFKKQWGALPEPMYWYTFADNITLDDEDATSWKKELFIKVWQKMPLGITAILGPKIRRMIHL